MRRSSVRYDSAPSVISIARSGGTSRKTLGRALVGQETVTAEIACASRRPIVSTRLLPPKLEPSPISRWIERWDAVGAPQLDPDLGPDRRRGWSCVPTSRTLSQWRPWPGFWKRTLLAASPGYGAAQPRRTGRGRRRRPSRRKRRRVPSGDGPCPRTRDVLEPPAADVLEHEVGDQA